MAQTDSQTTWLIIIVIVIVVALLLGLGVLVWWSLTQRPDPAEQRDLRRERWESAMAKAGVEASYPETPARLNTLQAAGRHSLDATFTGPELAALMNSYPLPQSSPAGEVTLRNVRLTFTSAGVATVNGRARVGSNSYEAQFTAPVRWDRGMVRSTGVTSARAEGFPVPRSRLAEATAFALDYVNGYLAAAPGLTIDEVTFEEGGVVHVKGSAPDRLE